MESTLLFIFGCILFLMFLGMLYGDRLSMIGLFDGRWFTPVGSLFGRLWALLTEATDRGLEFVLAHLSWVVAAVSGAVGLLLIAFLMGGGLAADAAAYHKDVLAPIHSGGVIDQLQPVPGPVSQVSIELAKEMRDDSRLVEQVSTSQYLVFGRPDFSRPWRPPLRNDDRYPVERPVFERPRLDVPEFDVAFRRLSASVLMEDEIPDAVVRGRLADPLPSVAFVRRALNALRNDNWNDGTRRARNAVGLPQEDIPVATNADVRNFDALVNESRVRFIPGQIVSQQDLRIAKTAPIQTETGEIEMEVVIRNMGKQTINGLLVREMMPLETRVRTAVPNGILCDDTMTWLVNDLRSGEEKALRFSVIPPVDPALNGEAVFESITEVSALTAVKATTETARGLPERRRERTLPVIESAPDLRMTIEAPTERGQVGEWSTFYFIVKNIGDAPADNVAIRLALDENLDHSDLLANPRPDRNVFARIRRIEANEERRVRLEIRPKAAADTISSAELIYGGEPLDSRRFRLAVRDTNGGRP